jgi:outer membrane lipopolysaccharide assembly protein LptE/RlpB
VKRSCAFLLVVLGLFFTGCGYHAMGGRSSRLPANVRTIAVPAFVNQTQIYRIEQIFTQDVVREFLSRTNYHVANEAGDGADATLKGEVRAAQAAPLTYDAQSGRVSSAVVTVTLKVSLVDRSGRVLFENPNYTFREQYQVSREVASFFQEETPALQRMSRDLAHTLVSDILEAY